MAGMVVLSVALRFVQEARADAAAAKLKAMIHVTATVIRDGGAKEMPLRDLVPGDIIKLSAGDMIPGDVRVLTSKDLFVSQGSLTGESFPVEKFHDASHGSWELTDRDQKHMLHGNQRGERHGDRGRRHDWGQHLSRQHGERDHRKSRRRPASIKGLSRFTWLMIRLMAVMVPLVFLINGFTKHDWKGAFFFAMAVAVGLTPEMLPMIVSVCLSKGALAMSRKKVIVKRLNAIQNFGGMDVLCTDKTGTLTEDRVVLDAPLQRRWAGNGRSAAGRLPDQPLPDRPQEPARPSRFWTAPISMRQALIEKYKKLDEIPFDFTRRMMSVMVEDPEGKAILLTKGAPEEVFHQCSHFELDGKLSPMDPELMVGLRARVRRVSATTASGFWRWRQRSCQGSRPAQRTTSAIWF